MKFLYNALLRGQDDDRKKFKFVLRNLFLREENVHLKKTIKYNPSLDQTFLQKLRSFKVYFLKESIFFVVILPLVANYIFLSFIKELSKYYDILV